VSTAAIGGRSYEVWFGKQAWNTISYSMVTRTTSVRDLDIGVPPTFRTADPLGSLTGKDEKLAGKYKTYSPEFKEEAAKLVINTSRPIADVARELKISETSLGNWVRAYREKHAEDEPPLQVSERARLRELERLNRELEMENAFLKKAAAYFAREHR
jgi:transposase-like protein